MDSSKTWYVYMLCDPDTEQPFYVGKGTGKRIDHHERDWHSDKNHSKKRLIRAIRASGKQVLKRKIAEFDIERDAYIYEWGMINLYHELLTNMRPGGGGALSGVRESQEIEELPPALDESYVLPDILSLEEVAKMLKVSERTVQREVKAGKLKAFRVGRALRFRPEAVEAYMQQQEISPDDFEMGEDDEEKAA